MSFSALRRMPWFITDVQLHRRTSQMSGGDAMVMVQTSSFAFIVECRQRACVITRRFYEQFDVILWRWHDPILGITDLTTNVCTVLLVQRLISNIPALIVLSIYTVFNVLSADTPAAVQRIFICLLKRRTHVDYQSVPLHFWILWLVAYFRAT